MKELLFFLQLFRPYWKWLVAASVIALIATFASMILLILSGWFITACAIAGFAAPDGVAIAFNFMQPAAEIRALAIIRTVGRYAERLISHEATFRVLAEIRCWFFYKLIPLAPGRLAGFRRADLLTGITQDIDALDSLHLRLLSPLVIALLATAIITMWMGQYSVGLALAVGFSVIIMVVGLGLVFLPVGQNKAKKLLQQSAIIKKMQIELLQGLPELCAFNVFGHYKQQHTQQSEQLLTTQIENNRIFALSSSLITLFGLLMMIGVTLFASILFQRQTISGAELAMLVFCSLAILETILPLANVCHLLPKTLTAAQRIKHIADQTPLISQPTHPNPVASQGDIVLKNVSFRYSDSSDWVLQDINLSIPQGIKIAITGSSGVGKSTLLQLIMRYFDPQHGTIAWAGTDYRQLTSTQLLQRFSLVSQATQIFSCSIRDNLLLAKPNATDRDLYQAIEIAGLERYLIQQDKGLDTWISEAASNLSGGERRRLALARAYLKNAPVLILDEPTEGLDRETENSVMQSLQELANNKTLILVSHKPSQMRYVDQVFSIENKQLITG